jgi:predicted dehydrogenase
MISRILIVGFGSIGSRHLKIVRNLLPHADIKILRHAEHNSIPEFSNEIFFTIDQALSFKPEIALIANPAAFHLEIAQRLANIGVHLLIEKPISNNTDGIKELIETCKMHNSIIATGYNLRYSPSLEYYRRVLIQEIVGEIYSVRCEVGQYLPDWRPEVDYRSSASAKIELGGGVLLELSHEIDYLNWIFGQVNWVRATLGKESNLEINVEDSAHLILSHQFKPNEREILSVINLDFIRHDHTRTCVAIGENGSLRWDGLQGTVDIFKKGVGKWERLFSDNSTFDETYVSEWTNFLQCIDDNNDPKVTGEDGLRVLEVIEAARKSALSGIQISVEKCY